MHLRTGWTLQQFCVRERWTACESHRMLLLISILTLGRFSSQKEVQPLLRDGEFPEVEGNVSLLLIWRWVSVKRHSSQTRQLGMKKWTLVILLAKRCVRWFSKHGCTVFTVGKTWKLTIKQVCVCLCVWVLPLDSSNWTHYLLGKFYWAPLLVPYPASSVESGCFSRVAFTQYLHLLQAAR